jgi:septal ring factor EnvC (AmiA/AmiB activator)
VPSGGQPRTKRQTAQPKPAPGTIGLALLALCLAITPLEASEKPPVDNLKSLEQQLEADRERAQELERQTQALRAEMAGLRSELTEAAGRAQDLEEELSALEQTLAVLEVEESRASQSLQERRREMARIVQGLQRLSLVPPESLILSPGSPVELARSGLLMKAAYPKVQSQAEMLRADLADLASLRADIEQQREELGAAQTALANERERLSGLLGRKEELEREASGALKAARERAQDISRQAETLRDLIEKLEEERRLALVLLPKEKPKPPQVLQAETAVQPTEASPGEPAQLAETPGGSEAAEQAAPEEPAAAGAQTEEAPVAQAQVAALATPSLISPPEIREFPESPGTLVLPARGSVVRRYNDELAEASGGRSRGLSIQARDRAQVVAPYDGRVVYAQPFRGYGLILIIEHRGKYHSLLSGLERIDAVEGQWVLAGEPVGVLGAPSSGKPELYLELRRDGQPIDPLPWLAMTSGKVKS